jgi:hypothetical protein
MVQFQYAEKDRALVKSALEELKLQPRDTIPAPLEGFAPSPRVSEVKDMTDAEIAAAFPGTAIGLVADQESPFALCDLWFSLVASQGFSDEVAALMRLMVGSLNSALIRAEACYEEGDEEGASDVVDEVFRDFCHVERAFRYLGQEGMVGCGKSSFSRAWERARKSASACLPRPPRPKSEKTDG